MNTPLDEDRLVLSCTKVDEPVEKEDKKMKSTTSKSAATLFDNFINKERLDESIPLHNGCVQEMRALILRGTIIQRDEMKLIKDIENGDEFSVPPELLTHFKSLLIQGQTRIEIEGLEIEKGKHPPFENNVLTLAQ